MMGVRGEDKPGVGLSSPTVSPDKSQQAEEIRRRLWGENHLARLALLRHFEPDLAELVPNDGFGGTYADERLTLEQRVLVTISSLVTQGRYRQLKSHIEAALRLGIAVETISAT